MKILGAVIAGGRSTRMGDRDKLALPWGGGSLVAHVAARLGEQVDDVIVNMSAEKTALLPPGLPIVPDADRRAAGPLAGLEAAMHHGAKHDFTHILTTAGDTPFFPTDLAKSLLAARGKVRILQTGQYPQPLFALWPVALGSALSEFLDAGETYKVMAFAKRYDLTMVEVDPTVDVDPFFNINTPEDLEEARALYDQVPAATTHAND